MFCNKCGNGLEENQPFCGKCGSPRVDTASPEQTIISQPSLSQGGKRYSFFVDQSEFAVAELGNSYVQNVISSQSIKKGFAVLTHKRLYYYGENYQVGAGSKLTATNEEKVIDLRDITGTGFRYARELSYLLLGGVLILIAIMIGAIGVTLDNSMIMAIAAIPFAAAIERIVRYFIKRFTLFDIRFAGGALLFDVKWFPIVDAQNFHRQLRLTKDKFIESEHISR